MAAKTITLKGTPVREELVAAGTITPGFLCERTSSGTVQAHSTAGGNCSAMFALEDDLQGNGITDDYSAADLVQLGNYRNGDWVYALLANGENASNGDFLESQGDGYLRVVDADASVGAIAVKSVVAQAMEAVDLSDSSGADPSTYRIKVKVI